MNMQLEKTAIGFQAKIFCRICEGNGVQATVPAYIVSDEVFLELSVQNELRLQPYRQYADKMSLPWYQRMSPVDFLFMGFIFSTLLAGVFGWIFLTILKVSLVIVIILLFATLTLMIFSWILAHEKILEKLEEKPRGMWKSSQKSAEDMYRKILQEEGIADHAKVILCLDQPWQGLVCHGSILVMTAPEEGP